MEIKDIKDLKGKTVAIYFDDGQKVNCHKGILKDLNDNHVLLFTEGKDELIPNSRIVRAVVVPEEAPQKAENFDGEGDD